VLLDSVQWSHYGVTGNYRTRLGMAVTIHRVSVCRSVLADAVAITKVGVLEYSPLADLSLPMSETSSAVFEGTESTNMEAWGLGGSTRNRAAPHGYRDVGGFAARGRAPRWPFRLRRRLTSRPMTAPIPPPMVCPHNSSVVEPNGMADDIRRKSVSAIVGGVSFHPPSLRRSPELDNTRWASRVV
jgi:hypothetical protein